MLPRDHSLVVVRQMQPCFLFELAEYQWEVVKSVYG